jgi:hypothetical protein
MIIPSDYTTVKFVNKVESPPQPSPAPVPGPTPADTMGQLGAFMSTPPAPPTVPAIVPPSQESLNKTLSAFNKLSRMGNATSLVKKETGKKGGKRNKQKAKGIMAQFGDMIVAGIQLPGRFMSIAKMIEEAGKTVGFGLGGLILSAFLAIKGVAELIFSIIVFFAKYIGCIIHFFVTLPFCFVSHIILCIWKIVYLIFPFTSCMSWYATGHELMPYYDKFFDVLDEVDDDFVYPMLGFYLTKFPPSIVKLCYTCNNKTLRLKGVTGDTRPIVRAGKRIGYDMGVTAPRLMRKATPHAYKTAIHANKAFS